MVIVVRFSLGCVEGVRFEKLVMCERYVIGNFELMKVM
jgi:hypothetical protein